MEVTKTKLESYRQTFLGNLGKKKKGGTWCIFNNNKKTVVLKKNTQKGKRVLKRMQ